MKNWQKIGIFILGETLVLYASLWRGTLLFFPTIIKILFFINEDANPFYVLVGGWILSMAIIVIPFTIYFRRYLFDKKKK
jgi:hypothetical protein